MALKPELQVKSKKVGKLLEAKPSIVLASVESLEKRKVQFFTHVPMLICYVSSLDI